MIEIAKIVKPQGIKGEVKAQPLTNVLAVFKSIENVIISEKEYKIQKISLRKGFLYIKFQGIDTRNDAENLRNQFIKVDKSKLEDAKQEDEFFIDDLIGMVLNDKEGNFVGQIVDVENYGAGDIFIIEKDGRSFQAPYISKVFIKDGDKLIVDGDKLQEIFLL